MTEYCMQCNKELDFLDIGAYRKFIDRGSTRYLCRHCLAERLMVTEVFLNDKIKQFRRQGCTLFL
ncbi:MAG: hypothetical protein LUF30_10005 [Lachnospiraceae bacterium]|nr:hypothetical protein [Lachnospiraceae bacterium]